MVDNKASLLPVVDETEECGVVYKKVIETF
jgi:hypothetical protein